MLNTPGTVIHNSLIHKQYRTTQIRTHNLLSYCFAAGQFGNQSSEGLETKELAMHTQISASNIHRETRRRWAL